MKSKNMSRRAAMIVGGTVATGALATGKLVGQESSVPKNATKTGELVSMKFSLAKESKKTHQANRRNCYCKGGQQFISRHFVW